MAIWVNEPSDAMVSGLRIPQPRYGRVAQMKLRQMRSEVGRVCPQRAGRMVKTDSNSNASGVRRRAGDRRALPFSPLSDLGSTPVPRLLQIVQQRFGIGGFEETSKLKYLDSLSSSSILR